VLSSSGSTVDEVPVLFIQGVEHRATSLRTWSSATPLW